MFGEVVFEIYVFFLIKSWLFTASPALSELSIKALVASNLISYFVKGILFSISQKNLLTLLNCFTQLDNAIYFDSPEELAIIVLLFVLRTTGMLLRGII